MRRHVRRSRPRVQRTPVRLLRRVEPARTIVRSKRTLARRDVAHPTDLPTAAFGGVQPNAYVDYERVLTAEGGIRITYKDIDTRWRHTIWRVFAWSVATGFEVWLIHHYSPVLTEWVNIACLVLVAAVNWLIVRKPVEVYRSIEIRPDCMIIEGKDVFWLRLIETNWPAFQADENDTDNHILCGIYGTRFVEYLTTHRLDECDRTPDVLATHVHDAMTKLWSDSGPALDPSGPSSPLAGPRFGGIY